ncbi:unnamed protein product, partial [Ectocarpus fasciculatus]
LGQYNTLFPCPSPVSRTAHDAPERSTTTKSSSSTLGPVATLAGYKSAVQRRWRLQHRGRRRRRQHRSSRPGTSRREASRGRLHTGGPPYNSSSAAAAAAAAAAVTEPSARQQQRPRVPPHHRRNRGPLGDNCRWGARVLPPSGRPRGACGGGERSRERCWTGGDVEDKGNADGGFSREGSGRGVRRDGGGGGGRGIRGGGGRRWRRGRA